LPALGVLGLAAVWGWLLGLAWSHGARSPVSVGFLILGTLLPAAPLSVNDMIEHLVLLVAVPVSAAVEMAWYRGVCARRNDIRDRP
jgi:hypothetical protein